MRRRYIGAVAVVAFMLIFACVLVGSTFAKVENVVDRRDGVYDVSNSFLDDGLAQYPVPRTTRAAERENFLKARSTIVSGVQESIEDWSSNSEGAG